MSTKFSHIRRPVVAAALGAAGIGALVAVIAVDRESDGESTTRARLFSRTPVIGRSPPYRPPPAGKAVATAGPVGDLRCSRGSDERFGVHLEVFAKEIDMVIPAGIGVAPPRTRDGAYVRGGRCSYPARTLEPTGLIEVEESRRLTLGQFFDLWGQPLSRTRLVGFRARPGERVTAYVNGKRWRGEPRDIPLARHRAIALEIGGYFPPPRRYVFPPGL
jgi:hypothetical protein